MQYISTTSTKSAGGAKERIVAEREQGHSEGQGVVDQGESAERRETTSISS
jgi:hypothetical protein